MPSRFRVIREIDFPDLEQDRQRHAELAVRALKEKQIDIVEALGLEILSHDPNTPTRVRIPPLREYEFEFVDSQGQPEKNEGEGDEKSDSQEGGSQQGEGEEQNEGEGEGSGASRQTRQKQSVPRNREVVEGQDLERGQEVQRGKPEAGQGEEGEGQPGTSEEGEGGEEGEGQEPLSLREGSGAGTEPAKEQRFEADLNTTDIARKEFEDLKLPDLREVSLPFFERLRQRTPKGHRKRGPWAMRNIFRSAKDRLSRVSTMFGDDSKRKKSEPFWEDDIKFRYRAEEMEPATNVVLVLIRDVSGSMDEKKRRWSRSFSLDLALALRSLFPGFEIVFVLHHTEGWQTSEWKFFHLTSGGGTEISSGYREALRLLQKHYPRELFNRVVWHLSDGENSFTDNPRMIAVLESLLEEIDFFGYLEVDSRTGPNLQDSTIMNIMFAVARRFHHMWVGPRVMDEERLVKAARSLIRFTQERGEEHVS